MRNLGRLQRQFQRWHFTHARQLRRAGWLLLLVLLLGFAITLLPLSRRIFGPPGRTAEHIEHQVTPDAAIRNIVDDRDAGRYDDARRVIQSQLASNPGNQDVLRLRTDFDDELRVDFQLRYLPGGKAPAIVRPNPDGVRLSSADSYYYTVDLSAPCFLYVFSIDAAGRVTVLAPNREFVPTANPLPRGRHRIPDGYGFLRTSGPAGVETVYLVATRWRHAEFERLARRPVIDSLLGRLKLEDQATNRLPGLVYGEFAFDNLGASTPEADRR